MGRLLHLEQSERDLLTSPSVTIHRTVPSRGGSAPILVERAGARVAGVIDWADIATDDQAVDFGSLAIWLGPKFVRDVAALAGAPDGGVERGRFRIRWAFADAEAWRRSVAPRSSAAR